MLFSVLLFFKEKDNYLIKNDTLRMSVVFVIGFIVVFFQKDVDFLLGFTTMDNNVLWYDKNVVCKCMAISNLTLQSFFWGYRINKRPIRNCIQRKSDKDNSFKNTSILNAGAFIMLFIFIVFVNKSYLFGGYGRSNMGIIADYCLRFAQGFITASVAANCLNYRGVKRSSNWIPYIKFMKSQLLLSLLFVLLVTLSGARHLAILIIFLNIIALTYGTGYRFNILQLVLGFIIVGTLITLIGIMRRDTYEGSLSSIDKIESILPFTEELSSSIMTLHAAVSLIPDVYPYNYGLTLIAKPFLIIPGMASFVQSHLGLDMKSANSSEVITTWVLGQNASFGLGSSSIADIYICFGLPGTLIIFFMWGVFLRYLENSLYIKNKRSVYFIIISFVVYSQVLYVSRESLFTTLQGISYPLLFYYLFVGKKR